MITVLHRGGPANDYGITWGWKSALFSSEVASVFFSGQSEKALSEQFLANI